jgi:hypothetical protein
MVKGIYKENKEVFILFKVSLIKHPFFHTCFLFSTTLTYFINKIFIGNKYKPTLLGKF